MFFRKTEAIGWVDDRQTDEETIRDNDSHNFLVLEILKNANFSKLENQRNQ